MTNDITLSEAITERISDWLSAANAADADSRPSIAPLMDDLEELGLDDVLPHFRNAIALSTDGYDWSLLIPAADWTWSAELSTEQVVVVPEDGEPEILTFDEIRANRSFWLEPGFEVHALDWFQAHQIPFRFDGVMWGGTLADQAFGEGEWMLRFNGDEEMFDLSSMELDFGTSEHAKPGRWVSIETGGVSMSTGEIGMTIYVTPSGGLFRYEWGYRDTLLGHADPDLDVDEIITHLDPEGIGLSDVVSIESDVLGKKDMRRLVRAVLDLDINVRDLDDVSVSCPRWSGMADELLR